MKDSMPRITPEPLWQTTDGESVRLYWGDVIDVAKRLPGKAVDCIVTSPPYWALRAYLNESDPNIAQEIGSEKTPEEYVTKMVAVFRELRRVLKDTGVVWLNLGDSYSSGDTKTTGRGDDGTGCSSSRLGPNKDGLPNNSGMGQRSKIVTISGLSNGNLVGIPWRVALALQADGWMLRQDIVWHKPAPMPESVQNRCTKAHEYIFLLTKSMDYYYDNEAIKEESLSKPHKPGNTALAGGKKDDGHMEDRTWGDGYSNKRSVWTISSDPYPGAHFATFPPKLIEPCILAGTSEHGCCANCGDPYKRVVERKNTKVRNVEEFKRDRSAGNRNGKGDSTLDGEIGETYTVGWEKTCVCRCDEIVPCTVLDCFSGAGTTQIVCIKHKRRTWGIELSKKYILLNQIPRIEGELLSRPSLHHLLPQCR